MLQETVCLIFFQVVVLLEQPQPRVMAQVPKLCRTCTYGSYGFVILQGRAAHVLKESAEALLKAGPDFLSSETLKAIKQIVSVSEWRSRCEKERTQVGLFEKGCGNWQAAATHRPLHLQLPRLLRDQELLNES